MIETQILGITQSDWFQEYRSACVNCDIIQKSWIPAVGDWFERHYHLDLSPIIIKDEYLLEIISHKSSVNGYWEITSASGRRGVWHSEAELLKGTSKWIPRLDQLISSSQDLFLTGSAFKIHMHALELFVDQLTEISK